MNGAASPETGNMEEGACLMRTVSSALPAEFGMILNFRLRFPVGMFIYESRFERERWMAGEADQESSVCSYDLEPQE